MASMEFLGAGLQPLRGPLQRKHDRWQSQVSFPCADLAF